MVEIIKLLNQYPTKTNKEISEMVDEVSERTVKRIRYTVNKANKHLQYIKDNLHKSGSEIDKELSLEPGTATRIAKIYGLSFYKKKKSSWSKHEIETAKEYYPTLGVNGLAKMLNISTTRVRVLASELGLKRDYQYNNEVEQSIINDYTNGIPVQYIAKKINRTTPAIYNFLYRRNIINPNNTSSRYYVSSPERYIIDYMNKNLNANIPDKTKEENRNYFWNVVGKYEIDVPIYIDNIKIAIEYDGSHWHDNRVNMDSKKDKALIEAGYLIFRINSKDHNNDYYNLESLNPILDDIINKIKQAHVKRF